MKRTNAPLLWGALLILAGIFFLLQNFGLIDLGALWGGFWALAFLAGGVAFLVVFVRNSEQWWALIPGCALLGLGALIGLSVVNDNLAGRFGGPLFLGSIGLGFWVVYLVRREQWWAIIPGGVLWSIGAMLIMEPIMGDENMVGVMFFGMAVTFVLVALLGQPRGKMNWAYIPAGVMLILAVFLSAGSAQWLSLVFPIALIVGGGFLLLRNALSK
ncbi:MAG: hypothetical protein K1X65_09355 [Caldilineales bacterium]|nr:hypothetical protein [Caldilineales bacterium]MCW5858994.1 hypothetical protein [Caldilineales bacterium]